MVLTYQHRRILLAGLGVRHHPLQTLYDLGYGPVPDAVQHGDWDDGGLAADSDGSPSGHRRNEGAVATAIAGAIAGKPAGCIPGPDSRNSTVCTEEFGVIGVHAGVYDVYGHVAAVVVRHVFAVQRQVQLVYPVQVIRQGRVIGHESSCCILHGAGLWIYGILIQGYLAIGGQIHHAGIVRREALGRHWVPGDHYALDDVAEHPAAVQELAFRVEFFVGQAVVGYDEFRGLCVAYRCYERPEQDTQGAHASLYTFR